MNKWVSTYGKDIHTGDSVFWKGKWLEIYQITQDSGIMLSDLTWVCRTELDAAGDALAAVKLTTLGAIWRDCPLSPEGRIKALEAENARLRQHLKWIYQISRDRLTEIVLPKRVDEMTPEEYAVYTAMVIQTGALLSARNWAQDALGEEAEA